MTTAKMTFAKPPFGAGLLILDLAKRAIPFFVKNGATAADVADACCAAINEQAEALTSFPMTATVSGETVTLHLRSTPKGSGA